MDKKVKNNGSKKNKRFKNYLLLIIIFVLSCGFTLYLCKLYDVYNEYEKETPVIRGTLSEIVYEDLDHYVVDVPSTIVYLCTSNADECRSFEKYFKKYVVKNNLSDSIVYLNLTGVDQETFVTEFNEKHNFKIKLNGKYPAFVSFRDGKVDAILQGTNNKKITISKVDSFIDMNLNKEEEE